jgi:uncharacterized protein
MGIVPPVRQPSTVGVAPATPIPVTAGISLKHQHFAEILATPPATGWFEVHSENYLTAGGAHLAALERIRRDYPLSCHGVGLSLGSATGLDAAHLARLKSLYERYQPGLVSEHLSWSVAAGVYLNDLLPLPYTEEALDVFCRNLDRAQGALGRQMAIENPSTYLQLTGAAMSELEFLAEVVRRTGCALLLDVNNVYVSACNLGFDATAYLDAMPAGAIVEIHVAGHREERCGGEPILIDDHGSSVDACVWALLRRLLARIGPRPVLVEWDTGVPALPVLLAEARKADAEIAMSLGLETQYWGPTLAA